ncbi:MAG TPA: LCCL domain-containing protein [Gemmataceae bacterium]|nr:LCCL domain-containing protein [Gemmataceae bacterium]
MKAAARGRRLPATLFAALALVAPLPAGEDKPPETGSPRKAAREGPPPGAVEVRFTDDSNLKLLLRDPRIEVVTPYGKLVIPVAEVLKVEFATRVPEEVARRIEAAAGDLGSSDYSKREAAEAELRKLREKAYAALLKAAKSKDKEVVRRAERLLEKVRAEVPEDRLVVRDHDVIHTPHSKIAGRIAAPALKAHTTQFGEVQLKLSDLLALRSLALEPETEAVAAIPDPGNMMTLQNQIGKVFHIRTVGGMGPLWGTDVYTTDSSVGAAAVHAGVLKLGQAGVVKVRVIVPPPAFVGSTRNGMSSAPFAAFPGAFQVLK